MKRFLLVCCVVAQLFFVGCFDSKDEVTLYPNVADVRIKSVSSTTTYEYSGGYDQEEVIDISFSYDLDGNVSAIESRFYVGYVDAPLVDQETFVATINFVLSYDEVGVVYVESELYEEGASENFILDEMWTLSDGRIVGGKAINNFTDISKELTYSYDGSNIQSVVEKVINGDVEKDSFTYSYKWISGNLNSYSEPTSTTSYSYNSSLSNNANLDINALLSLLISGYDYYDYKMLPGLLKMMGGCSKNVVSSIDDGKDLCAVSWSTSSDGLIVGADVAIDSSTTMTCSISYE
ncbi:MAG: hypothetical protein SNH79_05845 [Rikenellaceae bacterium]